MFFLFKQKTAYEMRISDWSSDVCSSDLRMGMLTVACIQPARSDIDRAVLEAELVALCREKLTRYKIPDEWRFLDSFPRNAMGKIVKPKLRELVTPAD